MRTALWILGLTLVVTACKQRQFNDATTLGVENDPATGTFVSTENPSFSFVLDSDGSGTTLVEERGAVTAFSWTRTGNSLIFSDFLDSVGRESDGCRFDFELTDTIGKVTNVGGTECGLTAGVYQKKMPDPVLGVYTSRSDRNFSFALEASGIGTTSIAGRGVVMSFSWVRTAKNVVLSDFTDKQGNVSNACSFSLELVNNVGMVNALESTECGITAGRFDKKE